MTRQLSLIVLLSVLIASFFVLSFSKMPSVEQDVHNAQAMVLAIRQKGYRSELLTKNAKIVFYGNLGEIRAGDIISYSGRISDVATSVEKKRALSYSRYMMSKGIAYFVKAKKVELMEKNYNFYTLRQDLISYMERKISAMYGKDAPLVQALVYGERSEISQEIFEQFAKSGTSHVLALSGFHVGIIAVGVNMLFAKTGIKNRGLLASALLIFYAFLTGLRPSIIRAVLFFIIFYISFLKNERYNLFASACMCASVLLAWNPYYLYDAGFVLSFAGVFSIALFYPMLIGLLSSTRWAHNKVAQAALVTISAQILTAPLGLFYFGRMSLVAVPANLLVVVLISFIMGLSMISLFVHFCATLLPIFYTVDAGLIASVRLLIHALGELNDFFAQIPYAFVDEVFIDAKQLCIIYVMIFSIHLIWERHKIKENRYEPQRASKVIIE